MSLMVQGGGGGQTGVINSGVQYSLAFYPSNGTTIDDTVQVKYLTGGSDTLVENTSGTNGSSSFRSTTASAGTGDAIFQLNLAGGSHWTIGADGSDSGNFKISSGDTPGTNDVIVVDGSYRVGIGTSSPTSLLDVNSDNIRIRSSKTPASAGASGNAGQVCWDSNYLYVCTASNTWKRAALSTW